MSHAIPYPESRNIGFGIYSKLPDLPEGWVWIMRPADFLQARDKFGQIWYADFTPTGHILFTLQRVATIIDWVMTLGRLRPGDKFMDRRFTYLVPLKSNQVPPP